MATVSYKSYLNLEKILAAQNPISPDEHDEMLFIIIHQTYELWFKQILHEACYLRNALVQNDTFRSLATLKRMLKILKTLVGQVDILETMTPISFLSFRHLLDTASGFQSWQFRCLEALLGIKHKERLRLLPEDSAERKSLEGFIESPSLFDALLAFLSHSGYAIPADILERDPSVSYDGDARVQDIFLSIYKNDEAKALLCENFIDLDEGIQEWRYRHVKMVERTVGDKSGTGGSLGARYLQSTLAKPVFIDLWRVRDRL